MKKRDLPYGILCLLLISFTTFPSFADPACEISDEGDVSINILTKIIRNPTCNVRSLDNLLARFPEDVRSKFTLFYESESVQGPHFGDPLHPRTILRTSAANKQLMMSFNGDPKDPTFNSFEVLEINRHHGKLSDNVFNYFEFKFPKENSIKDLTWKQVQDQITVSGPNPPQCALCHGNPAKPIYQGYPVWAGSYGSFHIDGVPEEKVKFQAFLKSVAADPQSRYRHLVYRSFRAASSDPDLYYDLLAGFNNSDFNYELAQANGLRVGALIQRTTDYEHFKYAIAGAFLHCEDYSAFFPPRVFSAMDQNLETVFSLSSKYTPKGIESALRPLSLNGGGHFGDINLKNSLDVQNLIGNLTKYSPSPTYLRLFVDTIVKQGIERTSTNAVDIRFVTESRGIDISSWFLDLMQPTYRTMEGAGSTSMIFPLLANDPDLVFYGEKFDANTGRISDFSEDPPIKLCTQLKQKSLSALQNVSVPPLPKPLPFVPQKYPSIFLNNCSSCHVQYMYSVAPAIPFSSQVAFENWLRRAPSRRALMISRLKDPMDTRRMPPNHLLGEEEVQSVINYVNSVSP